MSQDAVAEHCRAVKQIEWAQVAASWPAPGACDASLPGVGSLHEAYVQRFDAFRDAERAARLLVAIAAVGERARAGARVSWEGLCAIQALALGCPSVGFREGPAYANARMETYGCHPRLEAALAHTLARTEEAELHPLLTACRIYLDLRFFHPFAEGNSAAARLGFQWVLEREGLRIPELTPLFRQPIAPGDLGHYRTFLDSAAALWERAQQAG